ncbi:MAG: hypothetical protein JKY45_09255 [Emcibacter sp.]|nr:hypothetical protein [Emcibacter sp.]
MAVLQLTPTYAGYADNIASGFVQTNIGGGFPRTQLDMVGGVAVVNLRFVLSEWQHQYWKAFYLRALREGSLAFTMSLDLDGYDADYNVQIVQGSISTGQLGTAKEVTFQVYAQPIIDASYMDGTLELYTAYGPNGQSMLNALNQLANIDSNVLDF